MSKSVICIDSEGYPVSLTVGKVYLTLPDDKAKLHNMLRVIDDTHGEPGSEDGYLFPASMFVPIELPEAARQVLMAAAR